MFILQTEQWFPKPLPEVFKFFSDAKNLRALVPPQMDFTIVRAPEVLAQGSTIEYRLVVHGIRLKWVSQITVWDPPHRFVDMQWHGPYRSWSHEHTFEALDGGTQVHDLVNYNVYGGRLVQRWLVAPDLERIFSYRRDRLREIFG